MAKFKNYQQWQIDFIKENAENMTLQQLSDHVKLSISSIFTFCKEKDISTKNAHSKKKNQVNHGATVPDRTPSVYTQIPSPFGIATSLKS